MTEDTSGPRRAAVFTIPAHLPFLDALALGIRRRVGADPLDLADVTVLLPTRRSCRALREAFLRTGNGAAMLLPRLSALGDIDADEVSLSASETLRADLDLPPEIGGLRRRLLLARLIRHWGRARRSEILPGQAATLATDLARLMDQVQAQGCSLTVLPGLVPKEYARHWELTLKFLDILTTAWPAVLEGIGALDPAERRNRLMAAQAAQWRASPPDRPVIAAGFASAVPAAADLLTQIALLPGGAVVLPGLDVAADPASWAAIAEDPSHPQWGMAELLSRMGVAHDDVAAWDHGGGAIASGLPGRAMLATELMRPAAVTDQWRALRRLPADAIDGVSRLDCLGPQEEAGVIALILRERLEQPGETAMLVTPDRSLARRVAAELGRWGIEIDDSAGLPLNQTAPGTYLRLLAEAVLQELAPVPLLAALKHPLAAAGLAPGAFRAKIRALERAILRGPRPAPGIAGLRLALAEAPANDRADLIALVDRLAVVLGPLCAQIAAGETLLAAVLAEHVAVAEALAATDQASGPERLWRGDAGEALAGFVAELAGAAGEFEPIRGADYPVLLEALMSGSVVRPSFGRHPRLAILGTVEARLQQADLVILGGLNDGVWPADPGADPWLSRPMRQDFGLPSPEMQVGIAAHDFVNGLGARHVVLTRATRVEGAPTVPSRWLLRLDAVLRATGTVVDAGPYASFRSLQALLDHPPAISPRAAPAPRPPVAARPRRVSVTEVETWMRDPYALYAKRVLRLKALDPIDADPGAAERGSFIHDALDQFMRAYPLAPDAPAPGSGLPEDPAAALAAIGRQVFGAALDRPGVWAFWWPRFLAVAEWFAVTERARRPALAQSLTEIRGRLEWAAPAGGFVLTAKADRIDRLRAGGAAIIDYKTGQPPKPKDIELGFAPQLPLEAAILAAGGFDGVPAGAIAELAFWRLSGGDPAGEEKPIKMDAAGLADLARQAMEGLQALAARFDDPATPYRARPRPGWEPRYSDYGHLARVAEWATGDAS
ncbi:MAG TPA: double-strand break repair protein AddB [Stellaceae bacterium]|nr:double-strand break repair protein AddB [Stellaceae bacterium]